MKTILKSIAVPLFFLALIPAAFAQSAASASPSAHSESNTSYSLDFDPTHYTVKTFTLNGKEITYRAFEGIVYVAHPVDTKYQSMNFYVPEAYYSGQSIGGFTAQTAPIFLPNEVGGYMPGSPGVAGVDKRRGEPNSMIQALAKGFVVAAPGARGRTTKNDNGIFTGKAPAAIVDLKAAVRYLRKNDKIMPGDAEKIISNGTSAGGALSALLGATGNNPEFFPYLKAIGAADTRDDIFAVSAYCPITNLDHADMAHEWQLNQIHQYKSIKISMLDFKMQRTETPGELTASQISTSNDLKKLFPAYVNSLSLTDKKGSKLELDADGNGSFKNYVKAQVIASAQKALDEGKNLSDLNWVTITNGKVTDINFDQYLSYAGRMKLPPAFDSLDASSGENNLFGTSTIANQHFTQFSKEHSTNNSSIADPAIVKLMNPMNYIGNKTSTSSQHWRIRHGTIDKDTSLAIPVILATRLSNAGYDVDLALPWNRPHSGDYDLDELFTWISNSSK